MISSARLMGAMALAGGVALAAALAMPLSSSTSSSLPAAHAQEDPILFYRDPMGGPDLSKAPKKDGMGMAFVPVHRSVVLPLLSKLPAPSAASEAPLFWRDAMGGPEISLKPKKDSMGMDFLPAPAAASRLATATFGSCDQRS